MKEREGNKLWTNEGNEEKEMINGMHNEWKGNETENLNPVKALWGYIIRRHYAQRTRNEVYLYTNVAMIKSNSNMPEGWRPL